MTTFKDATLANRALESGAFEHMSPERAAPEKAASESAASRYRRLESAVAGRFRRLLDLSAMGGAQTWTWPAMIVATCLGSAVYGAAFGAWQGSASIGSAVIKLPVALLTTVVVAMILNCAVARIMGLRMGCAQSLRVTLLATAVASLLLGILAAGAWALSGWISGTLFAGVWSLLADIGARIGVGSLGLAQIPLVGLAGLAGASVLWHALGRFGRCPRQRRRVFVAWLLVLVAIGGPVIWALQPWVDGDPAQARHEQTARAELPMHLEG